MFNSVVLRIKAKQSGKYRLYPGKMIYSAFLKAIEEVNSAVSELQHSETALKAFTISNIINMDKDQKIEEGKNYFIRVTILDKNLFSVFASAMFKKRVFQKDILIGDIEYRVMDIYFTEEKHQMARSFDEEKELEKKEVKREIELLFMSPTFFKSGDKFIRELDLKIMYRGLLKKYNKYSDYEMNEKMMEEVNRIEILEKEIKTRKVKMKNGYFIGFVGKVRLRFNQEREDVVKAFNVLNEFAYYSGVGAKTTMGFGQIKVERYGNTKEKECE